MIVKMHAHFGWLFGASPDMPLYKKWLSFIFKRIELLNYDDPGSD
jgi:hypothetical protein